MTSFTTDFLRAVVDTLLPGLPGSDQTIALPAASEIGVDRQLAHHLATHNNREQLSQVLEAIAEKSDEMSVFVEADEEASTNILRNVETADQQAFQALLFVVSADYYENEEILRTLGWFARPPQPDGYPLSPFDETLLAPVKGRQKHWRSQEGDHC
ncbi:MAG: gluconate 2-dehydrogenase subunit 3 family protein [Chloroflexota bacterium]